MTDPTPIERLESGIPDLHVPAPKAEREMLLLAIGFVAAAAGLVMVIASWYGASGTRDVTNQVPYLISGGLGGLALVIIGVGIVLRLSLARLFRFWLARLLGEHQLQTDRTVAALGRIEALLAAQSGGGGTAAAAGSPAAAASSAAQPPAASAFEPPAAAAPPSGMPATYEPPSGDPTAGA
jgi:hypothetical protein